MITYKGCRRLVREREKNPRATWVYTSNCVKTRKVTKAVVGNRSQGTVSVDSWQSIILTTPALPGPILLRRYGVRWTSSMKIVTLVLRKIHKGP